MALLSSVPPIEFTEAGLVLPTDTAILEGVQADYDAAFGGGLNPALETPQGQLASSQSAIISDKNAEIATIVNQIDPQYADGRFQDAIAKFYFLTRKPATSTVVLCTLTGLPNTFIPAGTLAKDVNNNTYALAGDVTIPPSSTILGVEFYNVETGAIACPANTLTKIYQSISGWDTINNPTDGTLGSLVESRNDFEYRRKNSVALNARSSLESIYANVFNVENVLDVYATENTTSATVNKGSTNYPLLPHSLYVAVVGGLDALIGLAIWLKKDLGCDYNGNTTVLITDNSYSNPKPTYTVRFERPDPLAILFEVNIEDSPNLPFNVEDLIKSAIIARFNGTDGEGRERIGATVYASRYYTPVNKVSPSIAIFNILIGTSSPTLTSVLPGIDQHPIISAGNITVNLL
jgi:uncharacterized phage protein gp47/JayE